MKSTTNSLGAIEENRLIGSIARFLPRAKRSRNAIHETDAELLDVGLDDQLLAITTDCVNEEIASGLYKKAEEIGWVATTAALSDIAAVGAIPIGVMTGLTLDPAWSESFIECLANGIGEALRSYNVGNLGGDTNYGVPSITVTALGLVHKERVMRRIGLTIGDRIYVTGYCGHGAAVAFHRLLSKREYVSPFKPLARLEAGALLAPLASACMDTSDGLIATLDQLARLNHCMLVIENSEGLLHPEAAEIVHQNEIPFLVPLSVIHGEFELCFTVQSPENEREALAGLTELGLQPVFVGTVQPPKGDHVGIGTTLGIIDSIAIRNAWHQRAVVEQYLADIVNAIKGAG